MPSFVDWMVGGVFPRLPCVRAPRPPPHDGWVILDEHGQPTGELAPGVTVASEWKPEPKP